MIKNMRFILFFLLIITLPASNLMAEDLKGNDWLYTQTNQSNKSMTADKALQILKDGNTRFIHGKSKNRDLLKQAKLTGDKGQYPFAIVLSCMDSRGSPELIFDQGIGDIFSTRLAGNILDADQLGGLEYATKAVGSHLIVVMGHTSCGAVAGACSGVELGHLTQLLQKIQPAVQSVKKLQKTNHLNCDDDSTVDAIAKQNVLNVIEDIKQRSTIIKSLIDSGDVKIVGAMHNLKTGEVTFFS
jgi:carbonic anhydrase